MCFRLRRSEFPVCYWAFRVPCYVIIPPGWYIVHIQLTSTYTGCQNSDNFICRHFNWSFYHIPILLPLPRPVTICFAWLFCCPYVLVFVIYWWCPFISALFYTPSWLPLPVKICFAWFFRCPEIFGKVLLLIDDDVVVFTRCFAWCFYCPSVFK